MVSPPPLPVIDEIPGLFAILTPDGAVSAANRQLLSYCGAPLEELRNWGTNGIVHAEDLTYVGELFGHAISTGTPYSFELRIRRADGAYRWFDNRGTPVCDRSGTILHWYVLLIDVDDRRRAEDAVRLNERRFRLTINTIPVLVWSANPDGDADFFNQHYQDYVGLSADQLQGAGWTTAVHPDDLPAVVGAWQAMMRSGQGSEVEGRLRRFDGEYRRFAFRTNPLRDDSQQVVKWYGVNTDIEDRKRAEADLVEALHHLKAAQRLSQTGSYIADLGRDIHVWSDEFYRICEFEIGAEVRAETLGAIVLPEDQALFSGAIERAMAGEQPDFEFRIKTASGLIKNLHGIATRISEEPIFAGAVTDITERKKAEERLRRSEAFLAKAQELSLTGSFAWRSSKPDEFMWSEQMYRLYEIASGTPIKAELLSSRYHPDDRHMMQDALKRARRGLDIDYEHRIAFPDGRIKHAHVFATMAAKQSDEIEYFGAVQDVTQRRLSQEALDKVRAELEHAARVMSLGTLTASIAHEVNQPLSGVITNANTALRMLGADPPDISGAIATARRTIRDGKRASEVISKLRALFGKKEFVAASIDLNAAANEVLELTQHDLKRHRISFETAFDTSLPPVSGDRVQLQQVIMNLVLNAGDSMKTVTDRPRVLLVRTETTAEGACLSVQDTGAGIPAEAVERLFDPFYTTKPQGMGIGLSVSRSIIERHNGRLWASSNQGAGATFSFSLPCTIETKKPEPQE